MQVSDDPIDRTAVSVRPVEHVSPDTLAPHPRNYRIHTDEQMEHIKASIQEHGVYRNIIVARDSTILAGHGVWQACQELGLTQVPIVRLDVHPFDPRALKVLAGDNEISRLARDDHDILIELLTEVRDHDESGLIGTGYSDDSLHDLLMLTSDLPGDDPFDDEDDDTEIDPDDESSDLYTQKVETPIYTPTMDSPPPLSDLYDTSRRDDLVRRIKSADLPGDIQAFLFTAANRHVVFDYQNISEFYAHAEPEVQRLMEESALVIIDLRQAIELGYTKAKERILELIQEARDDEAARNDEA